MHWMLDLAATVQLNIFWYYHFQTERFLDGPSCSVKGACIYFDMARILSFLFILMEKYVTILKKMISTSIAEGIWSTFSQVKIHNTRPQKCWKRKYVPNLVFLDVSVKCKIESLKCRIFGFPLTSFPSLHFS